MSIPFDALDLNLLRAFAALYEERNVTRAAERIGIGQPAMSAALARLRDAFDDPLFVRGSGAMVPTPAAARIGAAITDALARLRGAVEPQQAFDAAQSKQHFRIATTDYIETVFFPHVLRRVLRDAPSVTIRITRVHELFHPPLGELESGAIDLAVGLFDEVRARQDALLTRKLFDDPLVCVARKEHPRIGARLTLAAFLDTPQIRVLYPEQAESGIIDTILTARGKRRKVACTFPHHASIPAAVAASDLLGVLPLRLARLAQKSHELRVLDPPIALPPFHVTMAWQARRQHDAAHEWLRELISDAASSSAAPRDARRRN